MQTILSFESNCSGIIDEGSPAAKKEPIKIEPETIGEIISKLRQTLQAAGELKSSVSASGMTLSKLIETAELSVRKLLLLQNNLEDEINKHQRYEKDAARRR